MHGHVRATVHVSVARHTRKGEKHFVMDILVYSPRGRKSAHHRAITDLYDIPRRELASVAILSSRGANWNTPPVFFTRLSPMQSDERERGRTISRNFVSKIVTRAFVLGGFSHPECHLVSRITVRRWKIWLCRIWITFCILSLLHVREGSAHVLSPKKASRVMTKDHSGFGFTTARAPLSRRSGHFKLSTVVFLKSADPFSSDGVLL